MLLFSDELMQRHDTGRGHPGRTERLEAVVRALEEHGGPTLVWRKPEAAARSQIERIHEPAYIDLVDSKRGRPGALDPDTVLSKDSVAAAYLAAGAAVGAVDAVMAGEDRHAFALVRPPGHHAEAHAAMGFCLFNNIAVAAQHAIDAHGLERVLIVDWDVHHGNGTQHSFFDRDDVLFCSLHQFPFYPGTGAVEESGTGKGAGFTVNVPFPAGCGDTDYRAAFRDLLAPIADAYKPELVMISAGFDAHRLDPLASMQATEEGYADMAATVLDIANRHAGGRLVLTLEGGYDLGALARSVCACVDVLEGAAPPDGKSLVDRGSGALKRVLSHHKERWKL